MVVNYVVVVVVEVEVEIRVVCFGETGAERKDS